MKIHSMTLDAQHFQNVVSNKKIYELRVFDKKRRDILLGNKIIFTKKNSNETATKTISKILLFDNFRDALSTINLEELLPGISSLDDGVRLYENIPHSTGTYKQGAQQFGLVMFKFV